jgi:hypothetical protein
MIRRITLSAGTALLALSLGASAVLAGNPSGSGQPSVSCDDFQPGPPGFGSPGFANAEEHYANPGSQGGTSSGNGHVVSQYDVACYHFSQHHS